MTKEEKINTLTAIIQECEDYQWERKEILFEIIKDLENEPKIGHWIMTSDYLTTAYGSIDYVKCSCCGEDSLEEGNYCSNCGAEMRNKDDSN